jgi:hypothetical protein
VICVQFRGGRNFEATLPHRLSRRRFAGKCLLFYSISSSKLTRRWWFQRLGEIRELRGVSFFPILVGGGSSPHSSCMCACVSLSHPRRSFEASELEGNTQRTQRHLWRPRKAPTPPRLNRVLPSPNTADRFLCPVLS